MSEDNTIAYPEWTKKGYRDAHEGDGLVMMRPFRARGTVQPQQCPTIMTGQGGGCGVVVKDDREPTIPIREDTERGYAEAKDGDGIKLFTTPGISRGVVQHDRAPTLVTYGSNGCGCGVVSKGPSSETTEHTDRLRIRYLTPRECWRLMGQPDWAYDRVVAAGTPKTHLYKQAGNSIVVDVLEAIFKGMYIDQTWEDTKPRRRMVTLDDFGGDE